ncbi:MAG: YwaF family protein, partial [Clostridia bacterium]|nr:YwaF family protein [Clostridia bacterium]
MEFLRGFLSILSAEMKEPTSYGWFHLMFVAIMIGVTVFLCLKFKNSSDKTFRIIVAVCWSIMFAFEIYKQFEYSYNLDTPTITWDYQWYAFPYQLCSTPLYVLPFIFAKKDSKFRDALIAYIATFSMFGGLETFIYPEQVFIPTIGINIQTMVHHGLQIVLGIFFIVWSRKRINRWFFVKSIPVFAVLVTIAIIA